MSDEAQPSEKTDGGREFWDLDEDCSSCGFAHLVTDGTGVRCLNCKAEFHYDEVIDDAS